MGDRILSMLANVVREAAHPLMGTAEDLDMTRAVEPLERTSEWEQGEVPETFPSGM